MHWLLLSPLSMQVGLLASHWYKKATKKKNVGMILLQKPLTGS
jgi:hypothetical protein